MATSGLVFAIHSFDFSNPENTRFQYGSSVCLLSMAAPIAGTCDDATPAMILATLRPRFADSLRFGFRFGRGGGFGLAGLAAIAFDRATAGEHHGGVVLLGGPGHHSREMTERVAVGRAQLGGEIDVAAELQHAVVVALEDRLRLRWRERELLQVLRLVGLELPAVRILHQRHAEHVDAVSLAGLLRIEHESARNIVIIVRLAGHRGSPLRRSPHEGVYARLRPAMKRSAMRERRSRITRRSIRATVTYRARRVFATNAAAAHVQ